jgi:hypothetical protein
MHERPALAGRWVTVAAVVLLAAFYIATTPANRSEADDAFWYAWDVEQSSWAGLLQPFHLLFLPLSRVVWLGASTAGLAERSYPILTIMGAVAAAATVVICWDLLVRRISMNRAQAAVAVGLLAFSYGFWRYSAEVEVYALALLWCAGIVNLALADNPGRAGRVGLVLLGATAPLIHILSGVLAGVAAPIAIVLRRGIRPAVRYVAAAGVLGLVLATAGYRLTDQPAESLVSFYAGEQSVRSLGGAGNIVRHAVAASQVVVSGNFLLTYPGVRDRIAGWFPSRMLADEIYAGEHAPTAIGLLAPLTLVALLAGAAWFLRSGTRRAMDRPRVALLVLGSTWLLLHIVAGVMFSPGGQPEVWMLALLPGWMLIVGLFVNGTEVNRPLVALVAALFAHNLIGGLWVYRSQEGDRGWKKGAWLIENSRSEDAILTADSPVFARFLRYWASADVYDLQYLRNDLRGAWTRARGVDGSVYATDDVFEPPAYYRVLRPVESDSLLAFGAEIQPGFDRVSADEFGGVWMLNSGAGVDLSAMLEP